MAFCCQQTAKIIDLLSANRQQTAKNIPYEKVSFIEKNPLNFVGFFWLYIDNCIQ